MDTIEDVPDTGTLPQAAQSRVDLMVRAYLKMRERIAQLNAEIEGIEEKKSQIEVALLAEAEGRGLTSIGTPYGTVIKSNRTRLYTTDVNEFRRWVVDNNCPELFETRLHQENVKAWVDTNPTNIPPGLQSQSKTSITIRKAKD
jgi:hypothetical protein